MLQPPCGLDIDQVIADRAGKAAKICEMPAGAGFLRVFHRADRTAVHEALWAEWSLKNVAARIASPVAVSAELQFEVGHLAAPIGRAGEGLPDSTLDYAIAAFMQQGGVVVHDFLDHLNYLLQQLTRFLPSDAEVSLHQPESIRSATADPLTPIKATRSTWRVWYCMGGGSLRLRKCDVCRINRREAGHTLGMLHRDIGVVRGQLWVESPRRSSALAGVRVALSTHLRSRVIVESHSTVRARISRTARVQSGSRAIHFFRGGSAG